MRVPSAISGRVPSKLQGDKIFDVTVMTRCLIERRMTSGFGTAFEQNFRATPKNNELIFSGVSSKMSSCGINKHCFLQVSSTTKLETTELNERKQQLCM